MPRFFFDIHDGIEIIDEAGLELPDLEAVRVHAMKTASATITNHDVRKDDGGAVVVTVRDEVGAKPLEVRLVFTVTTG